MRALIGLVFAVGLLSAVFPATVSAAKPIKETHVKTFTVCDLASPDGFVSAYIETDGPNASVFLSVFAPGSDPEFDPPVIFSATSGGTLDGTTLRATAELIRLEESTDPEQPPTVVPAGTATVAAQLTPVGEPFVFEPTDERDGNRLLRIDDSIQSMTVEGTLTLDLLDGSPSVIDMAECGATVFTAKYFITDPNAWVYGGDQVFVSCEWTTDAGVVTLLAVKDDSTSLSQVVVAGRETVLVSFSDPTLTDTTYEASHDLLDLATKQVMGTAVAEATFTPSGERITDTDWLDAHRFSVIGNGLAPNGSLTITLGEGTTVLPMDDASCDAGDVRVQVQQKMRRS